MSINSLTSYNPLSINGLDTVNINGNPFNPSLLVPYVGSTTTVDLNSQNIKTTYAPTASSDLTNKTYVDAQDALRLPYTGASSDTDLGTFKISSSAVPTTGINLTNKTYVDSAISASSLIPLNNTWTGTNIFNNTLSSGVGYTSNLNSIIKTIQTPSGQSAGNFTTVGLPAGVPVGSVLSGAYTLTAGVSSGAMGMWLGAYVYTSSQNSFSFTGMSGSQALVLYVYQYNTAGTLAVAINDNPVGYAITTSSATVSGSFLANRYSLYTGAIVFYFQASAVNQNVSFSGFFHDIGSANINGAVSITGITTATQINATQVNLSGITTGDAGLQSELTNILNLNNNFRGTTITANAGIALRLDGRGSQNPFQFYYRAPTLTSATEVMTIDTAGKVGIGIGAPTEKLTVQTATENYGLIHTDGTVSVGTYCSSANGGYVGTKSNHQLNFFTNNGVWRLRIDTGGSITQAGGQFRKNSSGNPNNWASITGDDAGNSPYMEFYYGSLRRGYIGNASASTFFLVCENNVDFNLYTGGSVRMIIKNNGLTGFGRDPSYTVDINGNHRILNGLNANDSMTVYGANATWGAYLIVGSGTERSTTSTAAVISTNGNLHLDAGNNNDIYYGYYANAHGTPNPHRWFGGNYVFDSVPNNTSQSAQPVLFDGNTFRRGQCVAKELYNNNSVAWGGGLNFVYAFYQHTTTSSVVLTGRYSGYWTGSYTAQFGVRVYNQNSGGYYFFTFNTFTNNAYNHTTIPLNCYIGNVGTGWNDIYVYNIGGYNTDGNDQINLNILTFCVNSY